MARVRGGQSAARLGSTYRASGRLGSESHIRRNRWLKESWSKRSAAKGDYLGTPVGKERMVEVKKEMDEEEASRASDPLIVWPHSGALLSQALDCRCRWRAFHTSR